jgi:hypothetical protein
VWVAVPLIVSVVGLLAIFVFTSRVTSEPTVETKVAAFVRDLKTMQAMEQLQDDPGRGSVQKNPGEFNPAEGQH